MFSVGNHFFQTLAKMASGLLLAKMKKSSPCLASDIFFKLANKESDIWSQASYRYAILWEAFLDPSDSYFLFADLVGFYTLNIYAHFSPGTWELLLCEY
jgi:hypothetical protein